MKNYLLPISIVGAGILIAGGIFLVSRGGGVASVLPGGTKIAPVVVSDHIMGNPQAALKVVEYSDLECPYCKHFDETMREVMQFYGATGKVAWVYRNFPLEPIHPNAAPEAAAAECAADQGGSQAFFKFTNTIYQATGDDGSFDMTQLPTLAQQAGLNGQKLKACMDAGTHKAAVEQMYKDGLATGAEGTPHIVFMLRDVPVLQLEGNQPYASIRAAIDQILQTEASSTPSAAAAQ